jgi:hypothetical protein
VLVDGDEEGVTPLEVDVEAGEHSVALRLDGYQEAHGPVDVKPGRKVTFRSRLRRRRH